MRGKETGMFVIYDIRLPLTLNWRKSKHYLLVVVRSRMNPFSFDHHNPTEKGTLTIIFILKKDMWTGIRRVLYAVHIALAIPEIDRHMF